MSPAHNLPPESFIVEALKIKHELLLVEAKVAHIAEKARKKHMEGISNKLGYGSAAGINMSALIDTRIAAKTPVITPEALAEVLHITATGALTTERSRLAISDILAKLDQRLIVIVGPCSIHDPKSALEYAELVKGWRERFGDDLEIVMRAYMEKPRTEKDWKGLVYDPHLDGSEDINLGLILTRMLACRIADLGVPIAMERLNALTPQYISGLVSYDAIGARNTTDQKAREYASGTSSPVGFKNSPEGSILVAVQAVVSARAPHAFLGVSDDGVISQINTTGNQTSHVILRGDQSGPNYSAAHVSKLNKLLADHSLATAIVIDASHGNSNKQAKNQQIVIEDVSRQIANGEQTICGVMIESHLNAGCQKLKNTNGSFKKQTELVHGQSITDECVGLDTTEAMLSRLARAVSLRRIHIGDQ